ncbi:MULTISPECIES: hypothetical protein [Trichocoleus]|uniref:Uncharacterized protein n=1 Tax=Trichocoleus desertorum GB2-A4 TaxID=2933944 RepID=A0ABV0JDW0_9CYAN|nr:hypothetical protein [Trichocoleus sp. FACHB-46]MBD1865160.1 hypothetical protein [Trichocoleus sp. FACHB-46]
MKSSEQTDDSQVRIQQMDVLPPDYLGWTAKQKQEFLWHDRILKSRYQHLPALKNIDVVGLFLTALRAKMDYESDEAPPNWKKAIHAHASVAKIQFVPTNPPLFTGLFQGADYGLLRLSVTGNPSDRGFAPGLAIKWLVDGNPSEDFSALVSLTGQGNNYNFFANEFSNIVPVVNQIGPRLINLIFMRVSKHPTKLSLQGLGEIDQQGHRVASARYPTQLFLVPSQTVGFPESPGHDFRNDLATIPSGTPLFSVYGTDSSQTGTTETQQSENRSNAQLIGLIKTTSEFVASSYGDSRLFFRHQRFGK